MYECDYSSWVISVKKIFFEIWAWTVTVLKIGFASNKIEVSDFSNSATVYFMSSTPQKNTKSGGSYFFKKRAAKVLYDFISDVSKKEVIGKLFLSLHYLTPRTTYAYHLRNDKMDHLVQSMEFKIDFTYNKLLAGLKMFQPRGQTYWEDDSVDVSLTRIFELITRIVLKSDLHNLTFKIFRNFEKFSICEFWFSLRKSQLR